MSTQVDPTQRNALTVTEVTSQVKGLLEDRLRNIWVTGEISKISRPSSGHWYFTLKDRNATLSAAMFRGMNRQVRFEPEHGLEVNVFGTVSVYERQGSYQIIVTRMEPAGLGALQLQFEQLKKKLAAEGLFDASRKRRLPDMPSRVGIVTSRTGAAVRDLLTVLHRRRPHLEILLVPVRVQGPGAAAEVASAIRRLNEDGTVEVIIAGRGGGSLEDLWAFNEEIVARSIAASRIPVVSAVGHETDHTIADLVADLRAPTPSAAAELVIDKPEGEQRNRVERLDASLRAGLRRTLERRRDGLDSLQARLRDPRRVFASQRQQVDELAERGGRALRNELRLGRERADRLGDALRARHPARRLAEWRQRAEGLDQKVAARMQRLLAESKGRVAAVAGRMDALSPLRVLQRGYAIATDAQTGAVLRTAAEARPGQDIDVRLAEGRIAATVKGAPAKPQRRGRRIKKAKKKPSDDDGSQGELPL